jgi:hypothetical protein
VKKELCELPIGTHTPEESLTYPTGHRDKDWPCTWLKLKGKKEQSNNIIITEVKLPT